MHLARSHPSTRGLALSGLLLGGGYAAGRVCARRLLTPQPLSDTLLAGEILRWRALGTEARYRVLGCSKDTVEVEVLDAPALAPGTRLRLTAEVAYAARQAAAGPPRHAVPSRSARAARTSVA
jgi:hypothetical protein